MGRTFLQIILFQFKNSGQDVLMSNAMQRLSQVIAAKRQSSPADAHIGFHTVEDAPNHEDKKAFSVHSKPGAQLFFKMESVPIKKTSEGTVPSVLASQMAGLVPVASWETWATSLVWSVWWPPSAQKGLTPIRPFVALTASTTIPPKKAVELVKSRHDNEPVSKKEEKEEE